MNDPTRYVVSAREQAPGPLAGVVNETTFASCAASGGIGDVCESAVDMPLGSIARGEPSGPAMLESLPPSVVVIEPSPSATPTAPFAGVIREMTVGFGSSQITS